ncbi:integrator complex subunit 9 [Brevipalpus obovatus]|uniref:integrator complex subunit 9 n=1 Tax=Brevipalpus obovatus TaxID=246614 RepID=UPI003D9DF6B2
MKLISLTDNLNKPCNLISFKDRLIMFDTGLDLSSCLAFLPLPLSFSQHFSSLPGWTPNNSSEVQFDLCSQELKECGGKIFVDSAPEFCCPELPCNPANVDVIFISNYLCLLGLPYITERTDFHGMVYATEPTIQIGKQFIEEIIMLIERTPKVKTATQWKKNVQESMPFPINIQSLPPNEWKQMYTMKELESSLSKVKVIGFGEKIDIFGSFSVSAHSSGCCIGSCNWVVETAHKKIVYLSSTSTLTTHPAPVDHVPLRKADVMIVTNLTQTPSCNPDSMLLEMCNRVQQALALGGNVLIPCYASGIIFDLFECLISHLDNSGFSTTPIYFISPVADQSLAYSNILAEWLTANKQSRVYLPDEPFGHSQLVRIGRLKQYSGIHLEAFSSDYRSPCVVFTGHPSLRFGDAVHFMEMWKSSPNNLVVFTEPDFPYLEALAPYQPIAMKTLHCPIDTSLNFSQVNKLIRELKPSNLLVSEKYTVSPPHLPHKPEFVVSTEEGIQLIPYRKREWLEVKMNRQFERAEMDSELAASLTPNQLKNGLSMVTVTCILDAKDNHYKLRPLTKSEIQSLKSTKQGVPIPPSFYTTGSLDLTKFMTLLAKAGITDASFEKTNGGFIIHLKNEEAFVTSDETQTHIVCDANDTLRIMLKNMVTECLARI